ncbi:MAG: cytochrome c family protein [Crocinitomicaceae bacterium]|nr:cytochrome c family protein [Crocinitomicaceae bacterium]|tara:strand:- start:1407 stop:2915 length:1509 start_codon:yes stop_codon:yes gene_type:complete
MKKNSHYKKWGYALVMAPLFWMGCSSGATDKEVVSEISENTPETCDCYSQSSLYNVPITFNGDVPGDLQAFNNQSQANCFAWQEFISLNWPINPKVTFGEPGNTSPVQWETYMPEPVLFQPNGTPPPAWGTLVSNAFAKKYKSSNLLMDLKNTKLLTFTSKFDADTLDNFEQAAPSGKPNWLGAQNGTNVWYEIMLNKDYYDFVVKNGYYNAATQHDSAKAGVPLNFPQGQYNGPTGAIELKAAWMEVLDPSNEKWKRYKLSEAVVLDPFTDQLKTTTVALVGLHIIHKTQNQPTWVWATFEQIDNVPDATYKHPYGYNFYDSTCTDQMVTIKNKAGTGDSMVTVTCTPNTSPPYYLSQGSPVPIQVTRTNPIDPTDAIPINQMMQDNIKKYNSNSVWQYYQLVDVIWSQTFQKDPTTPINAPRNINISSMASGDHVVANSTMESYIQNTTCYGCHMYSTIAPYPLDTADNDKFGDFSFVIGSAGYEKTDEIKAFLQKQKEQ